MRIVYCLPQIYKPGGIERIVSIKANHFTDICNYEVYIITSCQERRPPFYKLSEKIKLIDLNINYDSTLTLPLWKRIIKKIQYTKYHKKLLSNLLFQIKADIVISTFTHEASFLPSIKDGSKKVLEFHFCKGHKRKMANAFQFPFTTRLAYYFRCWQEENLIIPKYDRFVVLTQEDQKQWLAQKKPQTICIPNILPFESSRKAELNSKSAIAVGRLDAQKGFDRLINIWNEVNKLHPDWHLNIYGEGKDKEKLLRMIAEMKLEKNIIIHPPTNQIIDRYLSSSIFIMTSRYEGLPMTLLEAISVGLPPICYTFQCGPKDVIKDGVNGYLINENDEKTIILRIKNMIENEKLRKEMGNEAKLSSTRFSERTIMDKWINLFNSLCNN